MVDELHLSEAEIRLFNGEDRPSMYVAYKGIIFDVTSCPKWRIGLHEQLHFPGQDLTAELHDAPHGEEVFDHPCVKRVGRLV
jgi:predicted heme/steroid binding protein